MLHCHQCAAARRQTQGSYYLGVASAHGTLPAPRVVRGRIPARDGVPRTPWTILPPHPADVATFPRDQGPPPMPHLLGIDIGTSGTKTLICDEDGKVLATAMAEHPISSPKPGWS